MHNKTLDVAFGMQRASQPVWLVSFMSSHSIWPLDYTKLFL